MTDKIRPIDANAVRRKAEWIAMEFRGRGNELGEAIAEVLGECVDEEHAPTLDYAPVIRARWLLRDDGEGLRIVCSRCGRESKEEKPFCAECGAKMEGGKENV